MAILSWLETRFLGLFAFTGTLTGVGDEEKVDTELSVGDVVRAANEKPHGSPTADEDGEENCDGV